ncbi:glycosyltransferase family 4 protein [Chloroflexota bacterium]
MARSVSTNHDIYLICMEAKGRLDTNIKYVPLNIWNRRLYSTSLLFLFPSLIIMGLKLHNILRKIKPDIAHVHTHNSMIFSFLPLKILGIPAIFDVHGSFIDELKMIYGRETLDITKWRVLEPILFRLSDKITVVTRALEKYVASRGIKSNKIVRVPGGVSYDFFKTNGKSKQDFGISASDFVVMYTGNFNVWQGIDLLISSAKYVVEQKDNVTFVLVGHTNNEEYRNMVDNLGLSKYFFFMGQRSREEVPGILQMSDILILPRPETKAGKYGFPSKLPEYMASGKPVIATDVGDHNLLVKNMSTGLLVSPDAKEMAEAILRLIKDQSLRKRIGSTARQFVKSEYSWDIIGGKLLDLYEAMVDTISKSGISKKIRQ